MLPAACLSSFQIPSHPGRLCNTSIDVSDFLLKLLLPWMAHSWHIYHRFPSKSHVDIVDWSHCSFSFRVVPHRADSHRQPGRANLCVVSARVGPLVHCHHSFIGVMETKMQTTDTPLCFQENRRLMSVSSKIPYVCLFVSIFILMNKYMSYSKDMHAVLYLVTQSCLTLCDPMDYSLPGSSVHGDSPGKNTRVGCRALLQGIFPTQESNWGLLHCRQILYQLSYQGSPKICIHILYVSIICKAYLYTSKILLQPLKC